MGISDHQSFHPADIVIPVLVYRLSVPLCWLTAAFEFVEVCASARNHRSQMRIGLDGALIAADVRGGAAATAGGAR